MERMSLPPHAAEALNDSLELVTECSREIRTLSHLLHPPLLEEAGLPSSLRWYVEGFAQRSNVEVELHISDDLGRLPMELEITLFRIVQESLTNVYKYADATRVQVIVKKSDDTIRLTVRDNGKGFRPDQLDLNPNDKSGMGLMGMQERLRLVNGQFSVESEPGKGTIIRATIPLKTESRQLPSTEQP